MKKNNKKTIVIVSSILALSLIFLNFSGFFSVTWAKHEVIPLDYSGSIDSLGSYNPEGYIVDGGYNCGSRSNDRGVVYSFCKIDYDSLDFIKYEVCTGREIQNFNTVILEMTGTTTCLNWRGSRYYCHGFINFFDDENNLIGSYERAMRIYSDGWRGTDIINAKVSLSLTKGYKNITGEKCFSFFISNPSKSGYIQDVRFDYKINSLTLDYNPVECINNLECGEYRYCTEDFECKIEDKYLITDEQRERLNSLEITVQEQAKLIEELGLSEQGMIDLINELTSTLQEKNELIAEIEKNRTTPVYILFLKQYWGWIILILVSVVGLYFSRIKNGK